MTMKKRGIVLLLAMLANSITVFGQSISLTELEIPVKTDAVVLTLEEATQKALAHSTTLKNSNMDLQISEQKLESEEKNIAGGHTFQQLLNYIKQNANYTTSKLSQEVAQEGVKFSLKQVYIEIINKEREIAFTKQSIKNTEKELLIAICKEGKATALTSGKFIHKYSLPSSSSVQSALKGLLEKDFVTKEGAFYMVYDRFFSLWLRRM